MERPPVSLIPAHMLEGIPPEWYPVAEMNGIPIFNEFKERTFEEKAFQSKVKEYFMSKPYASEYVPPVLPQISKTPSKVPLERIPRPSRRGPHIIVVDGPEESLDMYLQRIYDETGTPFQNASKDCMHGISQKYINAIIEYANRYGLGDILRSINRHKDEFEEFETEWQKVSYYDASIFSSIRQKIPPLEKAIALFRVYSEGFKRNIPVPNHLHSFQRLSTSLSYQYAHQFSQLVGQTSPRAVFVRIDVLPGTHVYFLPEFHQLGICSQAEVVLLDHQRVHVYEGTECLEGRQLMQSPPVNYQCQNTYDESNPTYLPKVSYFFLISDRGKSYEYNPNYGTGDPMYAKFTGGAGELVLDDSNQLGYGNVDEIINKFIHETTSPVQSLRPPHMKKLSRTPKNFMRYKHSYKNKWTPKTPKRFRSPGRANIYKNLWRPKTPKNKTFRVEQ